MIAWSIALLSIGTDVGVHIDLLAGLPLDQALSLTHSLADAINERTGLSCTIIGGDWPACTAEGDDSCLATLRARSGATDIVRVRMFAGPTRIRLLAERFSTTGDPSTKVELHLAKDEPARFEEAAALLFPSQRKMATTPVAVEPIPKLQRSNGLGVVPWAVIGGSTALAVTGAILWIKSTPTHGDIETSAPMSDALGLRVRTESRGPVPWMVLGAALIGYCVGAILLLVD